MLLKYNNYTVQPVSITKYLEASSADRGNNTAEQNTAKMRSEDSALASFFRQVEKKIAPNQTKGPMGKIVRFDRQGKRQKSLREISNEILARMGGESEDARNTFPDIKAETHTTIYKYRSKADITNYDLPPIAVNQ